MLKSSYRLIVSSFKKTNIVKIPFYPASIAETGSEVRPKSRITLRQKARSKGRATLHYKVI